jgi:hypothetical protein
VTFSYLTSFPSSSYPLPFSPPQQLIYDTKEQKKENILKRSTFSVTGLSVYSFFVSFSMEFLITFSTTAINHSALFFSFD